MIILLGYLQNTFHISLCALRLIFQRGDKDADTEGGGITTAMADAS